MQTQHSSPPFVSVVALAAAIGTAGANAQNSDSARAPANRSSAVQPGASVADVLAGRDARVSALIGQRVSSTSGDDLGEIEDLIAIPGRDELPTVVLSIGGVLDVGDKWYATSFDELRVAPDGDGLVLDTTMEQLEAAPAFDYQPRVGERSRQPGVIGPDTANSIGGLLGATLVDESGEALGEVEDLVVSGGAAGTRVVVASDDGVGDDEQLVTIPFEELHIDWSAEEAAGVPPQPQVRVDFDDTVLASLPRYEYPEGFPN
jgi:sporulation protein YlmC with PRC-barrel domain